MFLVPSTANDVSDDEGDKHAGDAEFLAFTDDDVDYEGLQTQFRYGEATTPDDSERKLRGSKSSADEPFVLSSDYRAGREPFVASSSFSISSVAAATANGCESYRVVNVAVVFDAEFCALYGGYEASQRRIMTIVASASVHYERDMCVQLKLTDIYTPETTCSRGSSIFRQYNRQFPCGGSGSFLSSFARFMRRQRKSAELDEDATIHMFSGVDPPAGTVC